MSPFLQHCDSARVGSAPWRYTKQMVYKWKKRNSVQDRSHTAHRLQTQLDVTLQRWSQMMGQSFLHLRNFKPAALTSSGLGTESAQAVFANEPTAEALPA